MNQNPLAVDGEGDSEMGAGMRRRWTILVAVAVITATVGMATPASAESKLDCELGPAPQQTVIQDNGNGLEIHVLNAPSDAGAVADWVADYVGCLEGGAVNYALECVRSSLPGGPLVEVQPDPPVIIIHYEELLHHPCLL